MKFGVYKYFLQAVGIGHMAVIMLFFIISQSSVVGTSIWLGLWSEEESNDPATRDLYLGVYGAFGFGQGKFI